MKKSSKIKNSKIYTFDIPAYKTKTGKITCPFADKCVKYCYAQKGAYIWSPAQNKHNENYKATKENNFIDTILTHKHKDDAIFGPLSNNPGPDHDYQRGFKPNGKIFEISGEPKDELNGFCLGMTKESIQNNYYDNGDNFFSTEHKNAWGGQDVEIQERVGHSIVVGTCYVHHYKIGGWREIRKGYRGIY